MSVEGTKFSMEGAGKYVLVNYQNRHHLAIYLGYALQAGSERNSAGDIEVQPTREVHRAHLINQNQTVTCNVGDVVEIAYPELMRSFFDSWVDPIVHFDWAVSMILDMGDQLRAALPPTIGRRYLTIVDTPHASQVISQVITKSGDNWDEDDFPIPTLEDFFRPGGLCDIFGVRMGLTATGQGNCMLHYVAIPADKGVTARIDGTVKQAPLPAAIQALYHVVSETILARAVITQARADLL